MISTTKIAETAKSLSTPANVGIFLIMMANIASVVGVVSVNKMIYKTGFKMPSALMAFHFACTWTFVIGARFCGVYKSKWVSFKVYVALGMAMAAAVGFVNMSLVHNTVGTYQLLKFLAILITCVVEFGWKNKVYPPKVYAALCLLVVGVSLATISQLDITPLGLMFGLLGAIFVSLYQVYNKAVQGDNDVSALQLLEYEQPCSAYWCLMLAIVTDDTSSIRTADWTPQFIGLLLLSGLCAFGVNLTSFLIIGKTSPITYSVVGHAKTLLLFVVGFIVFEETMNFKQAIGLTISVFAILWYTHLTTVVPPANQQAKTSAEETEARCRAAELSLVPEEFKGHPESTQLCAAKMFYRGATPHQVRAFVRSHLLVLNGDRGIISESLIEPPQGLTTLEAVRQAYPPDVNLIGKTVMLKLNGGLGTTMGLNRAKSLVPLKGGKTFLDIMADQVRHLRKLHNRPLKFMLLNSFSTSHDTKNYLDLRYPTDFPASKFEPMEVMQSMVPKICRSNFEPVSYPAHPEMEWCPPGHGELWTALGSTGKLDELLEGGYEYMFVSNSDNLGATLDLHLLAKFAAEGLDFMLEVADRTKSDIKGSHLAKYCNGGKLLVRELAQTDNADMVEFYDLNKHKLFNTNSLWINLRALKRKLNECNGVMPLPVVRNPKPVDPVEADSTPILQLECAVGTAIQLFDRTEAVIVPRSRFSPVKMCNDLLAVRSDCYELRADGAVSLVGERTVPPDVILDDTHFKFLSQFEDMMNDTSPSLKNCVSLSVSGPVQFSPGIVFEGDCKIVNPTSRRVALPAGRYTGTHVVQ